MFEVIFVHSDLEGDQVQTLRQLVNLDDHVLLVPAQQREPLLLGAGTLSDEVGVLADLSERHAGGAKDDADLQPLHVVFAVEATPAGSAAMPAEWVKKATWEYRPPTRDLNKPFVYR